MLDTPTDSPPDSTLKKAVIYTRVSSKEQEEGFSLLAQLKLLKEYAAKNDIQIVCEFSDVETAKQAGRQKFNEMVCFLKESPSVNIILVEKTDRLYRNMPDYVTIGNFLSKGLAVHFVKEDWVFHKDSQSYQKLMHDIRVVLAKHFIDNLSEETKKGLYEKAETGVFPALAPFGYLNVGDSKDPDIRLIELDRVRAPLVKTLFEMYATGRYALSQLRDEAHRRGLRSRTGKKLSKSRMEKMLKDPFYYGAFRWGGKLYEGTHAPLISKELFDQVQAVLKGKKAHGYQKQHLAYMGIMRCGDCGCSITGEMKKGGRYVYYRCTNYHGDCPSAKRYYREEYIDQQLSKLVDGCYIDEERLSLIREGLKQSHTDEKAYVDSQMTLLNDRYTLLRNRLDNLYADKLDGKITEDFYAEKRSVWSIELQEVEAQIAALRRAEGNYYDVGLKFLELAQNLYRYWQLQQDRRQRGELIKALLSNCTIKDGTLTPTYRKPFDLIIEGLHSEEWGERRDLNPRPPGPQPGALTS